MYFGSSKTMITPNKPVKMGGYESRKEYSTGIADDLFLKCFAISQHNSSIDLLVLSYDLLGVDIQFTTAVKNKIREKLQINEQKIVIIATHTHYAPDGIPGNLKYGSYVGENSNNAEYAVHLQDLTVDGVKWAVADMRKCELDIFSTECFFGKNRRRETGICDPTVTCMLFERQQDKLGMIVNYACHPTSLPHQYRLLSADFPGVACAGLEEKLGCHVLFANGAAGDISTRFSRQMGRENEHKIFGDILANSCMEALEKKTDPETGASVRVTDKTFFFQGKVSFVKAFFQLIKMGKNIILVVPGELFVKPAIVLKQEFANLSIWCYGNDYIGYMPPDDEYLLGGYEIEASRLEPSYYENFLNEVSEWIRETQHMEDILEKLKGKLVVSCQAAEGEPFYNKNLMGLMAFAVKEGGASAIRANGSDIAEVRRYIDLPIIGILKKHYEDSDVYITPTIEDVEEVVGYGADIVAFDATDRIRPGGVSLKAFLQASKERFSRILFMADISNLEEAVYAAEIGADIVCTTLSGYVPADSSQNGPDIRLVEKIFEQISIPVFAEGRIETPEEAVKCLAAGAYAVVVGSAITRPRDITKRFTERMIK